MVKTGYRLKTRGDRITSSILPMVSLSATTDLAASRLLLLPAWVEWSAGR